MWSTWQRSPNACVTMACLSLQQSEKPCRIDKTLAAPSTTPIKGSGALEYRNFPSFTPWGFCVLKKEEKTCEPSMQMSVGFSVVSFCKISEKLDTTPEGNVK